MNVLDIFKYVKNLLNRLRGKPKRTPRKILQSHNRRAEISTPPVEISTPPVEIDVVENVPAETSHEDFQDEFQNKLVIDIKNVEDWENFIGKLNDLRGFEEFLFDKPLQWLSVQINRVREVLKKLSTPTDFSDDELNFNLAKKVRNVTEFMLDIWQSSISAKDLDENSRVRLKNLVEKYIEKIGVDTENFQPGDSFDDWAKLNMSNSFNQIATTDITAVGKIAEVLIQPHVIYYIGENGDVEKIIFGGYCTTYKRG